MKIGNLKSLNTLKSTGSYLKVKENNNYPASFVQNKKLSAESFKPYFLGNLNSSSNSLDDERITADVLLEIGEINESREKKGESALNKKALFNQLLEYENFENLDPAHQKFTLYGIEHVFGLTDEEILSLPDTSPLMEFAFISDFKKAQNRNIFIENLKSKTNAVKVYPIEVPSEKIAELFNENGVFSYENIKNALNKTNLNKYVHGFNLEYPRKEFVSEFKALVSDLSEKDQKIVYKYFNFNINSRDDIIKYPSPKDEIKGDFAPKMKEKLEEANKLINKFMLQNKVVLAEEDKELENLLNETIKVFPEFTTLIAKRQHRGDTMDFHTFDDIKKVYNSYSFEQLSDENKKILFISLLFHDFSKPEATVDRDHPITSAEYAKDIIKKLPLSNENQERIYNFIRHSHFATDGDSIEDIAIYFRRPNDFKMAEILGRADSASAGFAFVPSKAMLDEIQRKIDAINSNGILLFNENIPKGLKNLETTKDGVKYLDFSNPDNDVSKYGFKNGTKVKDLNFLCHASYESSVDFYNLLNGYKDICLSSSYLSCKNGIKLQQKPRTTVILSAPNSNIVSGGRETVCTGKQKDYRYLYEALYKSYGPQRKDREAFSIELKQDLNLNNEEYIELFQKTSSLNSIDEIQDITFKSGRTLKAGEIIAAIENIQKNLTSDNLAVNGYINEFVVHNPKIQAFVIEKDLLLNAPNNQRVQEVKKASQEFNVPLVAI